MKFLDELLCKKYNFLAEIEADTLEKCLKENDLDLEYTKVSEGYYILEKRNRYGRICSHIRVSQDEEYKRIDLTYTDHWTSKLQLIGTYIFGIFFMVFHVVADIPNNWGIGDCLAFIAMMLVVSLIYWFSHDHEGDKMEQALKKMMRDAILEEARATH